MHTTPCGTTRFSRFLRNSFLRFEVFAAAAAAAPPGAAAASFGSFATLVSLLTCPASLPLLQVTSRLLLASRDLLRRYCALPRTLARARIGVRALPAYWQIAAVTNPAVSLNFNQAADVHLLLFAEVAFDAPFRFDRRANRGQLILGQVLDLLAGVHLGLFRQSTRPRLPDSINRGEPNPQPLVRRQIYACDTSHNFLPNPGAAGASRWCRSPALRRADALLCTSCRFSLPMPEPSFSFSHLPATAPQKPLASDYAAPSTCTGKRSARASGRTAKAPPPRDHLTGCG